MSTESGRETNDWDRVCKVVGLDQVFRVNDISIELGQEFAVADQSSTKIQNLGRTIAYEGAAE